MREIKFRGRDIKTNKWIYGSYFKHQKVTPCPIGHVDQDSDYAHLIINGGFSDWNLPKPIECTEVDSKSIGQYIEKKDRNNKDIYEGDILRRENYWDVYIVYDSKNTRFAYVFTDSKLAKLRSVNDLNELELWRWEIIGNIYDNPELLEE